jgi:hypothetical protein
MIFDQFWFFGFFLTVCFLSHSRLIDKFEKEDGNNWFALFAILSFFLWPIFLVELFYLSISNLFSKITK